MSFTIARGSTLFGSFFTVKVRSARQAQEHLEPTRELFPDAGVYDEAGHKLADTDIAVLAERERSAVTGPPGRSMKGA